MTKKESIASKMKTLKARRLLEVKLENGEKDKAIAILRDKIKNRRK